MILHDYLIHSPTERSIFNGCTLLRDHSDWACLLAASCAVLDKTPLLALPLHILQLCRDIKCQLPLRGYIHTHLTGTNATLFSGIIHQCKVALTFKLLLELVLSSLKAALNGNRKQQTLQSKHQQLEWRISGIIGMDQLTLIELPCRVYLYSQQLIVVVTIIIIIQTLYPAFQQQ